MIQTVINTCFETTNSFRAIAYYTHLVPVFIMLVIATYVISRKDRSVLNMSFFLFIIFFSLWLVGDLLTWVANDYHTVVAWWSILDYVEIITFLFSLYFFVNFLKKESLNKLIQWSIIILSLPALYIAIRGLSVVDLNHAVCEVTENSFLSLYKVGIEILSSIVVIVLSIFSFKSNKENRLGVYIIASSLLLLLLTFSITGYISSQTGVYEILLYGLFAIPVFLLTIVFTIARLNLFNLKLWSQQLIAYVLVVLVFSELFFTKNTIGFVLTSVTAVMAIIFVFILTRSIKKENEARLQMEFLNKQLEVSNKRLKELDAQKTEFISLASHQLRGPLTAIKGYASMVLEGDFGQFSSQIKEAVETIFKSTQALVVIVGDYLDISRIEQGRMKYDFTDFDVKELVQTVVKEVTPNVQMSNLSIELSTEDGDFLTRADQGKIKQVISNLIDNSSKYTKQGGIKISVSRDKRDDILISIKDTGVGIEPEVMPRLFEKFSRAPDASKANIMGTGLGLYVARKIIEAHRGRIWAESEGKGKGATFFIELEPLHSSKRPHFTQIEGNISKEE